jgi:hypothetical protein
MAADLKEWLDKQKGKKAVLWPKKSVAKSPSTSATPAKSAKGKEKATESASGSGVKKGNVKQVVIAENADNKKDHKKKKTVASSCG